MHTVTSEVAAYQLEEDMLKTDPCFLLLREMIREAEKRREENLPKYPPLPGRPDWENLAGYLYPSLESALLKLVPPESIKAALFFDGEAESR